MFVQPYNSVGVRGTASHTSAADKRLATYSRTAPGAGVGVASDGDVTSTDAIGRPSPDTMTLSELDRDLVGQTYKTQC